MRFEPLNVQNAKPDFPECMAKGSCFSWWGVWGWSLVCGSLRVAGL